MGRTSDSIDTLRSSVTLLDQRGEPASIPDHDLQLRLARLNNELGALYAAEFNRTESMQCYESAVKAASQLDASNSAGLTELARAHLNLGNRPPQLRRGESLTPEQRADDLQHVHRAIEILEGLKNTQAQSKTTNILYASSLLARSRLATTPHSKRTDFQAAVSILRDQLNATPDDPAVRFELVETLADVNLRGQRSPRQYDEADDRLREALKEIGTLRVGSPDNAVYLATEVHLRHKLSAIARTQSRFDDADALLSEAIRLQTLLMQTWPDNVRHRCWRAMLHRSQAIMYREAEKLNAAKAAIASAETDLDAIDSQFADHPLVVRTRDAIHKLADTKRDTKMMTQ